MSFSFETLKIPFTSNTASARMCITKAENRTFNYESYARDDNDAWKNDGKLSIDKQNLRRIPLADDGAEEMLSPLGHLLSTFSRCTLYVTYHNYTSFFSHNRPVFAECFPSLQRWSSLAWPTLSVQFTHAHTIST